ncbi:MAG: hypothetical protein OEZ43_21280 [Gammaproteobacteria bacterium]|nr:hypothetical protein [Gammaproteobacteria bacterium]
MPQLNFADSLLNEIECKAKRFSLVGLVDPDIRVNTDEQVLILRTTDLCDANSVIQDVDLMRIRWYISLESATPNRLSFSRYLETLYLAVGLKPHVYIEYIAFDTNPWITEKRRDGFLVTTFSVKKEPYLPTTVLSGENAILMYLQLLCLIKNPKIQAKPPVEIDSSPGVGEIASKQALSRPPLLLPFSGLKIDIITLWQGLQSQDRKYVSTNLRKV